MLNQPLQIGSLTVPNRVFLAPLAGVSDAPFRRICTELGAGLTYVEMLNTVALLSRSKRTAEMLERHPSERILGVQLTGRTPETVAKAVAMLDAKGFDTIDINMGCPVRKVVHSECGSAFLRDPPRITSTVQAARAMTRRPLSAKFRLGFERPQRTVEDTTRRVVEAGVDFYTIHGRYRSDDYGVRVEHDAIRAGMEAVAGHPVISVGNGDIMDLESARQMVDRTGCDAVMLSRGALGNPWLFREILDERPATPTIAEWEEVVLRHIDYQEECYGDQVFAAARLRKHLIWYASGYPGSNRVRNQFNTVSTMNEARAVTRAFTSLYPRELRRFVDTRMNPDHVDPRLAMDRQLDRGVGADGLADPSLGG